MNLDDFINQIGAIVDYNPSVPEYREELRNIINDIYIGLFAERKYKFCQKELKVHAFADVAVSGLTLFNDYNGPIGSYYAYVEIDDADIPSWLSQGCIIEIVSGEQDSTPVTLPNLGEYWITSILPDAVNPTKVYFQRMDKDQQRLNSIYERTPRIGNSEAESVSVVFKHRYITLPQDCVSLTGIGLRDISANGQDRWSFDNLSKFGDEQLRLDMNQTGLPNTYIVEPDYYQKPPMIEPIATITVGAIAGFRAPFAGKYEVCYTFVGSQLTTTEGIGEDSRIIPFESGPSPVSDAVIPNLAGNDGINITGMQITNVYDGLKKRYYVRLPGSDRFYAVDEYPESESATSSAIPLSAEVFTSTRPLYEHGGVYQRIRLYPRQDKDYVVTLRYMYRPQRLVDNSDSPDLPAAAHKYLLYRACEEVFTKHSNLNHAKIYQGKADKELLNLDNRYLTESTAVHIKNGFSPGYNNSRGIPRTITKI